LVRFKNSAAAFAADFLVQPPPPKKIRLIRRNFSLASRQHRKKIGIGLYQRLTLQRLLKINVHSRPLVEKKWVCSMGRF